MRRCINRRTSARESHTRIEHVPTFPSEHFPFDNYATLLIITVEAPAILSITYCYIATRLITGNLLPTPPIFLHVIVRCSLNRDRTAKEERSNPSLSLFLFSILFRSDWYLKTFSALLRRNVGPSRSENT